jgi:hypothetical protein
MRPPMGLWRLAVLVAIVGGFWGLVFAAMTGAGERACVLHELTPRQAAVISQWAYQAKAGDYVIARECFRPKEVAE